MIEIIDDLPGNVVGFEAVGEVSAADYREILDPAISAALAHYDTIRVLYVLGDRFTGYTGPAMWDDAVEGTEHWRHWERIGVVTDTSWVRHTVHAFAWMMPARIKVYDTGQLPDAIEWVCAPR